MNLHCKPQSLKETKSQKPKYLPARLNFYTFSEKPKHKIINLAKFLSYLYLDQGILHFPTKSNYFLQVCVGISCVVRGCPAPPSSASWKFSYPPLTIHFNMVGTLGNITQFLNINVQNVELWWFMSLRLCY